MCLDGEGDKFVTLGVTSGGEEGKLEGKLEGNKTQEMADAEYIDFSHSWSVCSVILSHGLVPHYEFNPS